MGRVMASYSSWKFGAISRPHPDGCKMWEHKAQLAITFAQDQLGQTVPQALVVLGLGLAGVVVGWIILKLGECATRKEAHKRWERENNEYKEKTTYRRGAIVRVFSMLLAILSVLVGLTIGFNAAGFNFWTIAFGGGIVTLVATYSFNTPLQSVSSYLAISITEKVEEGWYMQVNGMNVEGRVTSIHVLWVELEYLDENQNLQEIQVPTTWFINYAVRRLFDKEKKMEASHSEPLDPNVNGHIRNRLRAGYSNPFSAV